MSLWLSDEEMWAMKELRYELRCLYIFGIRPYMNSQTKITGLPPHRISYQSLSEEMYKSPERGVKKKPYNKESIRRAIKALEKAGLVKIESTQDNLILKCVLAPEGKSKKNKADTKPTPKTTHKPTHQVDINFTEESKTYDQEKEKADTQADMGGVPKADTPLLSNIYINTDKEHQYLYIYEPKKNQHPLPDEFCVTDKHREWAKEKGYPLPDDHIEAFKDYHQARGNVMKDWNKAFYTWLRNALSFGPPKPKGVRNEVHQRPQTPTGRMFKSCAASLKGTWYDPETITSTQD